VQAGPHVENGVPYIRTGDIKNGRIGIENLFRTSPEIARAYQRSEVRSGDIIISIRATVGTTAILPSELNGANLTQGTARISPGPNVKSEYLLWALRSQDSQRWIERQVKGATFREITLGRLRQLPVLVPPDNVQTQFASAVQKVSAIEKRATMALSQTEALFSSLQTHAFRGDLLRPLIPAA
jgi:type I restriction enzyme S subunit